MPHLNDEHISYIRKDLHFRGIVLDGIEDELLDHICCSVEERMDAGDRFIDAYHKTLNSFGHGRGLRIVQKSTIKKEQEHTVMMLGHYITIAIRNSRKYALFTFINVTGLALGVAACFLISLLIVNELSFDRYHEKADRIVRITNETTYNGNTTRTVRTPAPLAKALSMEFSEVESAAHLPGQGLYFVKRGEGHNNIKVEACTSTTNDLFKIMSMPFVAGDPTKALLEPNTVVLSAGTAKALFGNEDPLNQPLILDNHMHVTVVGVFENFPENSHIHFNLLTSEVGTVYEKEQTWVNDDLMPRIGARTYVLLREGTDVKSFNEKLGGLVSKYIPTTGEDKITFGVQALTDIHLQAGFEGDFEPSFDLNYVYILGAIAVFILGIASINFVNLSTARSSNRAKEVGMRKVMGSLRGYIVKQFLVESVVLSFIAVVVALGLAWALLPHFNLLTGRRLEFPLNEPLFYVTILGGVLLLGVVAGLYPSVFLSSFRPAQVLKGTIALGVRGGSVRSALVVSQFAISIFLVIGTIVLFRQLNFINNKNVGFNRERIIMVEETYLLRNQKEAYKNEALKSTIFTNGTISGFLPAAGPWRLPRSWWRAGEQSTTTVTMQDWGIDADYFQTLGMNLKAGRNFLKGSPADSTAVLVNETALKVLGLTGDVVGQTLGTYRGMGPSEYRADDLRNFTIVGVVEDFHFESMKAPIGPVIFRLNERPAGSIVFRFEEGKTDEAIVVLEELWKKMAPGEPFTYDFMSDGYSKIYASEKKLSEIFGMFTTVALLIACLGLFALITFTTEQRKKEVGIRKVMGASITDIVLLFSKELSRLIMIAFVLAVPLAWYTVEWWLKDYNYRVEVGVYVYLCAGVFAIALAWLTTSFQSVRSAMANPAESLRSE
ncbi:MAG TPA: ABC transporter permease [Cyclobacteriaceae bacterium]|nr:ABC transporter permease [Cyclobacteriaceae bacterium]